MHKGTMMGLCLMVALGVVLLEANASSDADVVSLTWDASQLLKYIEFSEADLNLCKQETGENHSMDILMATLKINNCFADTQKNEVQSWNSSSTQLCKKAACAKEAYTKLQVCLTAKKKDKLNLIFTILEFACSRDGDQIALFKANQGPECLTANKDGINNCLDKHFSAYEQNFDGVRLLALLDSPTFCVDLKGFEPCVLNHLEQCSNMTPASILQSIFKMIKGQKDCQAQNEGGFLGGLPRWIVAAGALGAAIFILIFYLVFCK